jgi:hypothetical protein
VNSVNSSNTERFDNVRIFMLSNGISVTTKIIPISGYLRNINPAGTPRTAIKANNGGNCVTTYPMPTPNMITNRISPTINDLFSAE